MFQISNKTYDVLKVLATIVLPSLDALYITLSQIWGWGFGEQIDATLQAIIAFVNAMLGLFIAKSSSDYHKGDA